MQTFLSSPNFAQSAATLDPKRLNKQIVEGNQILSTLLIGSKWQNHPAVLQWGGHEKSLQYYIDFHLTEAHKRGFKTNGSLMRLNGLIPSHQDKLGDIPAIPPPWLGEERFHSSHRSRLLFKGRVDAVCGQLKTFLGVRSINSWLKANSYPEKTYFKHTDIEKLERYSKSLFDLRITNHYSQFSWTEDDLQEYYWPVKNSPK